MAEMCTSEWWIFVCVYVDLECTFQRFILSESFRRQQFPTCRPEWEAADLCYEQ